MATKSGKIPVTQDIYSEINIVHELKIINWRYVDKSVRRASLAMLSLASDGERFGVWSS